MSKHIFAFYKHDLSTCPNVSSFKDATLWQRLQIVRIKPGDRFILFDRTQHVILEASSHILEKRIVAGTIIEQHQNTTLQPNITLLLPILKKDALAYAVYVAAQMGVHTIVPLITQKSAQTLNATRLNGVLIAACEQAKQFIPPILTHPIPLQDIPHTNTLNVCLDEHGTSMRDLSYTQDITMTLGPEGGFTQEEKDFLAQRNFTNVKLTDTVLRSREAVCVGLGIIRSFS